MVATGTPSYLLVIFHGHRRQGPRALSMSCRRLSKPAKTGATGELSLVHKKGPSEVPSEAIVDGAGGRSGHHS